MTVRDFKKEYDILKDTLKQKGFKVKNIENGIHATKINIIERCVLDITVKVDPFDSQVVVLDMRFYSPKVGDIMLKITLMNITASIKDKHGNIVIVVYPNTEHDIFSAADIVKDFIFVPIKTVIAKMYNVNSVVSDLEKSLI